MKRLTLLPLLFVLAACSSTLNAAGTTPTTADSVPATGTGPGVAKTPVPESTASPTATEDPLANAPEGTDGVDENGKYYMDAENGNRYYYDQDRGMFYWDADDGYRYYYKEDTLSSGEVVHYLARPLIKNFYAYDDSDIDAIPITVWVKLGTPGSESIIEMTRKNVSSWDDRAPITDQLNDPLKDLFNKASIQELITGLNSRDGMSFTFTVNDIPMEGRFGTHSGVEVTMVDKRELIDLVDQNLALAVQGTQGRIYYTVDGVKENGTVMFRIAHDLPLNKLLVSAPNGDREYEFRKLIVLPLANLLVADSDQLNVYNLTLASILASRTGFDRQNGTPDLNIVIKP